MNPSDLHALTGAYALNALDDDERREFEVHLAECPACQQEVREFAATAAELGGSLAVTPPPSMKAQVMGTISATRQEPPVPRPSSRAADETDTVVPFPRRRLLDRVLLPAAAVLAVLVVGLAVTVGNLNTRVNELEASTVRVADIVAAPDLRTWSLTQNGTTARVVYSATQGQGLFLAAGLQPPPDGKVYELWLIGADGATPAGLFTSSGGSVTHPMTGDVVSATHIGVTVEPAGGSPQPTTDPILVLEL
jgi:anti-sigma-K factor RskA